MIEPFLIDPRKKLVRVKEGRLISGVCRGISMRYRLPLMLVRVFWTLLILGTFFIGGILLYILLVIKLPLVSLDLSFPKEGREINPKGELTKDIQDFIREFFPVPDGPEGDKLAIIIFYTGIIFLAVLVVVNIITFGY